ncbi:MAG: hypothetical protein R3F65_28870 [bacterium]
MRAPLAFAAALALPLATPARAADCYATDAVTAHRWPDAEAALRRALDTPACQTDRAAIRYSLAHAIERQTDTTPARACEAERHYRQAARESTDPTITTAAREATDRLAAACLAARPPVSSPPPALDLEPAPEPAPDRTAAWATTAGAIVAAGAGATLLTLGVLADGDRQDAEATMRARHAARDDAGLAAATADFHDAADRATAFGLAGWGTLALAAGLGATATWLWLDDTPATLTITPTTLGVSARF